MYFTCLIVLPNALYVLQCLRNKELEDFESSHQKHEMQPDERVIQLSRQLQVCFYAMFKILKKSDLKETIQLLILLYSN